MTWTDPATDTGRHGSGPCRDCGEHSAGRWPGDRCGNCWDAFLHDRPRALYRLYDQYGQLLYVGIATDVARRFREHRKTMPWWAEVAAHHVTEFPAGSEAATAERTAIRSERPLFNRDPGLLPEGCPDGPAYGVNYRHKATYWGKWRAWRAVHRDFFLNPEEMAALGRQHPGPPEC